MDAASALGHVNRRTKRAWCDPVCGLWLGCPRALEQSEKAASRSRHVFLFLILLALLCWQPPCGWSGPVLTFLLMSLIMNLRPSWCLQGVLVCCICSSSPDLAHLGPMAPLWGMNESCVRSSDIWCFCSPAGWTSYPLSLLFVLQRLTLHTLPQLWWSSSFTHFSSVSLASVCGPFPVLWPGHDGGIGSDLVEDQEDVLPDCRTQLVRVLHHIHDPPQLWSAGQTHTHADSNLLLNIIIAHCCASTAPCRPSRTSTSSRRRWQRLFWSTQTRSSLTSSSWRCCSSGSPTASRSTSPTTGAGSTSSSLTWVIENRIICQNFREHLGLV